MVDNYYEMLGLDRAANMMDIKRAYKKSALRWHPDRPGGNDRMFQLVGQAYDILKDSDKRREYDTQLSTEFKRLSSGNIYDTRSPKRQKRAAVDLLLLGADDESLWEVYEATPNFNLVGNSFQSLLEALEKFEVSLLNYRKGRRVGDQRAFQIAYTNKDLADFSRALAEAYERDTEVSDREAKVKQVASRLLNQFAKQSQI